MPGFRYPLGNRIPIERNQWTQGLRWFYYGGWGTVKDTRSQRSRVDRALAGFTGNGAGSTQMTYRGSPKGYQLTFPGNAECYLSWGNADRGINQNRLLGDVTMIASLRCRVGGTGQNYNIGGTLDGSNGFCITAVGNNTTSSWSAFTRETGTTLSTSVVRTDTTVGNFTTDVVALRLRSVLGTIEIWQNGILGSSNTSTAKVWNSTDSLDFKIAGFPGDGTSERLIGDIYWIAIFDMAIPGPAVQMWSRSSDPTSLIFEEEIFQHVDQPSIDVAWMHPTTNFRYTPR